MSGVPPGRATALKGEESPGIDAETRYAVQVQPAFKGGITGTIVVNRQGGKGADDNE